MQKSISLDAIRGFVLRTVITILFSFSACFLISARANSQDISMNLKNVPISDVFKYIEDHSDYRFVSRKGINFNTILVTVQKEKINIAELLKELASQSKLRFDINNRSVAIKEYRVEEGKIEGSVIDDVSGEPVAHASIKIGNHAAKADENGKFHITLPAGQHVLEISATGYIAKKVMGISITHNAVITLNLTLQRANNMMSEVVVVSTAKDESIKAHFARQKNAAGITDGISAEQIARTPDNNMGQVLKRVSGITTLGDKYVVVRGLNERYNQAMLDGITLPSTSMNRRNFSFDALPQEIVSNVVVNKTATPDLPSEFGGGLISINTMDIPLQNFTILSAGTGWNTQAWGKDFYRMGKQGPYNWLGFTDKSTKMPDGIQSWFIYNQLDEVLPPGKPGVTDGLTLIPEPGSPPYSSLNAVEQSKKFSADGLKLYRSKFTPNTNFRFSLGRAYSLDNKGLRLGFALSASLRNKSDIVEFNNARGGHTYNWLDSANVTDWEKGKGLSYRSNAALGLAYNIGLQGNKFKIALKNMYTSLLEDQFNEKISIYHSDFSPSQFTYSRSSKTLFQLPTQTAVWQHKLEGYLMLPADIRWDYYGSINSIGQKILDQRDLSYNFTTKISDTFYYTRPDLQSPGAMGSDYPRRMWTNTKQTDYNWGISFSRRFWETSNYNTLLKIGYQGWSKRRSMSVAQIVPYTFRENAEHGKMLLPYDVVLDPANVGTGKGKAFYWVPNLNGPVFDGDMRGDALYAMLDQKFFKKLRAVYGIRAENYHLNERQEAYLKRRFADASTGKASLPDYYILDRERAQTLGNEKKWELLPSVNLTYNVTPDINLRLGYAKTAIRPDFRELGYFGFYDYELNGNVVGRRLMSTKIDNIDLRFEWYPSPEEIVSVSGFYKYLDKPIELVQDMKISSSRLYFQFQNQHSAKNYGAEIEFRKNLGFLSSNNYWLKNLYLFGNATLIASTVIPMSFPAYKRDSVTKKVALITEQLPHIKRPLFEQSPWIVNAGISYLGEKWGTTISYNRSGYRTFTLNDIPAQIEYENGTNQVDFQLYGRFLKRRLEAKLNIGNLLNEWRIFYMNWNAYEKDSSEPDPNKQVWKLVKGTVGFDGKDKGDVITYKDRKGTSVGISLTYRF